jgi:hypothetical protein
MGAVRLCEVCGWASCREWGRVILSSRGEGRVSDVVCRDEVCGMVGDGGDLGGVRLVNDLVLWDLCRWRCKPERTTLLPAIEKDGGEEGGCRASEGALIRRFDV